MRYIQSLLIIVVLFVDNQEDDFIQCRQTLFTDFHDQQNEDKENQGFPDCSQSILQISTLMKR